MELLKYIISPEFVRDLIAWGGYFGLFLVIFSETGLLVGFFLPGDSLLVTAGLLAATPIPGGSGEFYLNIYYLNLLLIPAAIIGDAVGYYIGYKTGHLLYKKEQSFFFRRDHLIKTKEFYEKYGGITIIIARFIPLVRTFAPTVAGIAQMKYIKFLQYNVFGGIFWILSMTFIGYFLGKTIPNISEHIEKVIIVIVLLSISPIIYKLIKSKLTKRKDRNKISG